VLCTEQGRATEQRQSTEQGRATDCLSKRCQSLLSQFCRRGKELARQNGPFQHHTPLFYALRTPRTACQVSELPRPPRADEAGGSLRSLAHPTARCLEMSLDQPNIQTPQAFHHTASACPSASSFSKRRTKQRVLTPLSQLAYGLPNPLCWNRLEQLSSQNHDHAYPLRNRPRSLEAIPHGLG